MRVVYVAPSVLPSKAANAVHVVMQCQALANIGCSVTLFAQRSVRSKEMLAQALQDSYGTRLPKVEMETVFGVSPRMASLKIAAWLAWRWASLRRPDTVLSRNLYASWLVAVLLRRPLLFETHQIESGFRGWLQKSVMTSRRTKTIVISRQLATLLADYHRQVPAHVEVLHDAAPDPTASSITTDHQPTIGELFPQCNFQGQPIVGYFGHLYPGRGLEIIVALAERHPEATFLVVGGNDDIVANLRSKVEGLRNFILTGHVPHQVACAAMKECNVLLMPYQRSVSIGVKGHDTSRWMSPMKMFEYMASGVPIIASDLPVLREVLVDGENCLLVPPDRADAWSTAISNLIASPSLARRLASSAYAAFLEKYTWQARARRLVELGRG